MFVERAFPTLLVPNRDLGVMAHGEFANGFFTYQIGGFNGVPDGGTQDVATDHGKDVVGRVFFHPFRPLGSEWLDGFGLGAAGSYGRVDEQTPSPYKLTPESGNFFSYRAAAGAFLTPDTEGDRIRWSPQAYWYVGPVGVLGEYVASRQPVHRDFSAAPDRPLPSPSAKARLDHTAWQVAASVALTGEKASYNGLIPSRPFDPFKRTWGAFEVAARYNEIHLDPDSFPLFADHSVSADRAQGWTAGLNWYLNRYVTVMANFDHTWFHGGRSLGRDRPSEDTILTRLQLSY